MKIRKPSERRCTGCKEMKDKKNLLRIVKNLQGEFLLDITLKQAGRGAYVCKNINCIELSKKNKGFERSFKSKLSSDLYNILYDEINKFNINGGG